MINPQWLELPMSRQSSVVPKNFEPYITGDESADTTLSVLEVLLSLAYYLTVCLSASVAQSDAIPTGDHGVVGSFSAESGNIILRNIFYEHSLPSAVSRRAVVSFWRKNVLKYWLTTWRTKPFEEKCDKLIMSMCEIVLLIRPVSSKTLQKYPSLS